MFDIKCYNDEIIFPDIENYLDELETNFSKQFNDLIIYPTGKELRIITEEIGGKVDFESQDKTIYDTLNLPYERGILIIKRPWINIKNNYYKGHKVFFYGNSSNIHELENSIRNYIYELHVRERELSKKDFIEREIESTDDKQWVKRIINIF